MSKSIENALNDLIDSISNQTDILENSRSLIESPEDYAERIYPHINKVLWYSILKRLNGYLRLSSDTGTSKKASRMLLSKAYALIQLVPCLIDLGALSRKDDSFRVVSILSDRLDALNFKP